MNSAITIPGKLKRNNVKASKQAFNLSYFKTHQAIMVKISALFIILGIIGLGAYRVTQINSGKMLPRVQIAGINVGGKTPDEAKAIVQNYINDLNTQGLTINYDSQKLSPTLDDLGVSFNIDGVVNEAYGFGRSGNFQTRFMDNMKMTVWNFNFSLNPEVNNQKMDEYLNKISDTIRVEPVSAGLKIDSNGNVIKTAPKNGRGFDKNKLKNDLTALIDENKSNSSISLETTTLTPEISENGTLAAKAQAEQYINLAPINVNYNEKTFTASRGDIGSWLTFNTQDDHLVAEVDANKVSVYANWISSKIVVKKIDKEIMEGTEQVLTEGQDGIGVDANRLTSDLRNRVLSASNATVGVGTYLIPKNTVYKNPHAQACRYATRYIDINLSEQTLYAFDGCTLVNQFLISGGKTGATPTGEFHVYGKSRVTRMDGPGYDLPGVEWVSWFSGDYSIHGTYWHNNFGHPMSHGCVNASNTNAQWVYEWDSIGTPIYIHN